MQAIWFLPAAAGVILCAALMRREPFHLGLLVPGAVGLLFLGLALAPAGTPLATGCAHGILTLCLLFSLWLPILGLATRRREAKPPQWLLVPGYALHKGQMTRTLELRLETALEVLEAYPDCKLLLSGGSPRGDATEAGRMREWLLAHGVADGRILTESASRSSWQNLSRCKALYEEHGRPETWLVTSWWHILRMRHFAGRLSFPLSPLPCPAPGMLIVPEAAREAMILVKTALFGPDSMPWANGRL